MEESLLLEGREASKQAGGIFPFFFFFFFFRQGGVKMILIRCSEQYLE
jgi:hypothetical protein